MEIQAIINNRQDNLFSARLLKSIERFDNKFKYFLKSQNLRWLLIDLLAPLILAISAIYLLISAISAFSYL
jgi:hypothetical protein